MQDLIAFIKKYSNLLTLIALEVIAFMLVISGNPYPKSTAVTTANRLVAWEYEQVKALTDYFHLRSTNLALNAENARLATELSRLEVLVQDSIARHVADSVCRGWYHIPARVVLAGTRESHNYITIDAGTAEGVQEGMGVRCAEGAVGIVARTEDHYSLVVPIIHTASNLSVMFRKNGYHCNLRWDGDSYHVAQLEDVATHAVVEVGDTIVTSGLTAALPENIPVGVVTKCTLSPGASYYDIDIELATNFRRIRYVQVVRGRYRELGN